MRDDVTHEPLVSIIVNNYNYGRFIQDAIESALNQTYRNVEVIVVDDGSTDNSPEIISKYFESGRIKAIFKENGGQASAMNSGFQICRGDLVMFLDSDDVLKPEAIEMAVNAWHPGVSKVQWRLQEIDGDGNSLGRFFPPLNAHLLNGNVKHIARRWFNFCASPQSGNMYSREFLNRAMPLPESDWKLCADFPLYAAAVFFGDIVSLPNVLGYYRLHGGNAVGLKEERFSVRLKGMYVLRKYLKERFPEYTVDLCQESLDEKKMRLIAELVEGEFGSPYGERVKRGLSGFIDSLHYPFFTSKAKRIESALWFLATGILPIPLARIAALKAVNRQS